MAGSFPLSGGLVAEIASGIEELSRSDWEKTVPAKNLFLNWDFLHAFEQSAPANLSFRYVQLYDGKKPVAAFYFQVVHLSAEEIGYILRPLAEGPGFAGQLSEWLKRTKEEKGFRLLVSGNNFISGEYGVAMAQDADAASVFSAFADVVKVITKNDRTPAKISAILVKDYFSGKEKLPSDELKKKRYHRFVVEPEMIVSIGEEWKTFSDYLAAMSKKYRNRAKAVLKRTDEVEVVELDGKELENASPEIFNLYRNVHERAKFRLSMLPENYFTGMKKAFPGIFRIYGYRLDGKWVAFRSSFHLPDHLEAHFIGLDYACNEECPLYQRLLYDFIREGIESGYSKVYLGRTAAEMKSTVGATAHDLVCYIRHRNGLSNQMIRPFIDYLKPSPWVPRNPFREAAEATIS